MRIHVAYFNSEILVFMFHVAVDGRDVIDLCGGFSPEYKPMKSLKFVSKSNRMSADEMVAFISG